MENMTTVLDDLGEPNALSPLSTNVHDEDFSGLGDHTEGGIVETHLHSDADEALGHEEVDEDVDDDVPNAIVTSAMTADDDDDPIGLVVPGASTEALHHVTGLETVHNVEPHVSEALGDGDSQNVLDEQSVLNAEGHLVQDGEQESILLATDSDGNMAMPVSPDQVIRFLMQTSDGNVVAADAQVDAIKFSMSGLMASAEAGEVTQTIQAVTLPDGTTTFFQTPKDNSSNESQVLPKLIEGQTIKLEDGTTALLQPTSRDAMNEGLQAIQLEDGTTAFISHPNTEGLFDAAQLQAAGLHIDQLTSQTMMGVVEKPAEKALVIGDKAYKCAYQDCGRLYTTLHHLKVHERSHTGDRPFTCEYPGCGKAFATGYGLKSHNRVHTGEKPYPCPEMGCEKAFKTSGDLQKHVRTHTGERPFKCPFEGCTRSFTTSNIRKVHIRTHTGERPYICDVEGCGRAFASATNYKNHIRIHTGEKPYVCTVQGCGKAFTEYSSLYKHHVVHTHTKPYTCCYCGKTYRQTSTLAMHKRSTHGEDMPTDGATENGFSVTTTSMSEISGEPSAKKTKIKTEIEEEVPDSQLVTSAADVCSQMVLLTSQVNNNAVATVSAADSEAQLASLVTLQSSGTISLQDLQQSGLQGITSLALGDGGQQVLVVTDPAQLEALQQLAAQQLESLTQTADGVVQTVTMTNPE